MLRLKGIQMPPGSICITDREFFIEGETRTTKIRAAKRNEQYKRANERVEEDHVGMQRLPLNDRLPRNHRLSSGRQGFVWLVRALFHEPSGHKSSGRLKRQAFFIQAPTAISTEY
jgi:hypothetical protein